MEENGGYLIGVLVGRVSYEIGQPNIWIGAVMQKPPVNANKAGYTVNPIACGWAGAIVEVTSIWSGAVSPKAPKTKKVKCDRPTDRRMDGPNRL